MSYLPDVAPIATKGERVPPWSRSQAGTRKAWPTRKTQKGWAASCRSQCAIACGIVGHLSTGATRAGRVATGDAGNAKLATQHYVNDAAQLSAQEVDASRWVAAISGPRRGRRIYARAGLLSRGYSRCGPRATARLKGTQTGTHHPHASALPAAHPHGMLLWQRPPSWRGPCALHPARAQAATSLRPRYRGDRRPY